MTEGMDEQMTPKLTSCKGMTREEPGDKLSRKIKEWERLKRMSLLPSEKG